MARLTKRLVDQLTVPEAPSGRAEVFVWDSSLPGFGVRVLASGRKTYLVQYRDQHGRTRRYALGAHGVLTPEQARTLAQAQLARVKAGENPSQERSRARQAATISQLTQRYERDALPTLKPKTQREYRRVLRLHILPALGTLAVPAVTTDDLAALQTRLAHIPDQANRVLSVLRTLFRCAEQWQMRPPQTNPSTSLRRYAERKRERYLRPEELARLGMAMQEAQSSGTERPEALALVRLLLFTGARLGEIQTLRWEWIDLRGRRMRLPDSKTGAKTLYLSPAALAVLASCGPQVGGLVVPGVRPGRPQSHPYKVLRRLATSAEIAPFCPHDLRHTYASMGVTLGLSLPIVGQLLGHTEWATTQRYAHLAPNPVEQATELVGEALARALGG
jgi:integrase